MSAEEKAIKLVEKYRNEFKCWYEVMHNVADVPDSVYFARAKACAIITCDEILNEQVRSDYLTDTGYKEQKIYWQSVKQQISEL